MSVKIRLALTGKTHQISYRLVAQDTRSKRDGKFLEILGFFNPSLKENQSKVNKERIKYYISKGATFTPSAKHLVDKGTLPPKPKKERAKKEAAATPQVEEKTADAPEGQIPEPAPNQPQETPMRKTQESTEANQNAPEATTESTAVEAVEAAEPSETKPDEKPHETEPPTEIETDKS